jgi:hypothetical protein
MANPDQEPDLPSYSLALNERDIRHLWCVLSNDVSMQQQIIDSPAAGQSNEDMLENAAISRGMITNSRKILQIIDMAFKHGGE